MAKSRLDACSCWPTGLFTWSPAGRLASSLDHLLGDCPLHSPTWISSLALRAPIRTNHYQLTYSLLVPRCTGWVSVICSACAPIHLCGTSAFCGNGTSSQDGGGQVGRIVGGSTSQKGRQARLARVSKMIDPMSIKLCLKSRNCSSFSVSQLRGPTFVETFPCDKPWK